MKSITLNMCVDDDFEPGCCYDCPLSYESTDPFEEINIICVLGHDWIKCPMKPNLLFGNSADILIIDEPVEESD